MIVWRNGALVDGSLAVSAADRGWLIGDAVFETVLIERETPAFLGAHLARLSEGCGALGLDRPLAENTVTDAIGRLAEENAIAARAACRLTISRVGGARGLAPASDASAQLTITLSPTAAAPESLRLIVSRRRRFTAASTNRFKCAGAYAENMLARVDAAAVGADEALMLNEFGRVASASAANVFAIAAGAVRTPPASEGALPGIVRSVVLEEARKLGVVAIETPLRVEDLQASTILLTNSLIGAAIGALDGAASAGDATLAARLIAAYRRRLEREIGASAESPE